MARHQAKLKAQEEEENVDEETLVNTDHKSQLNLLLQTANAAAGGGVSEGAVEEVAEMVDSVAVDVMVDTARAQVPTWALQFRTVSFEILT